MVWNRENSDKVRSSSAVNPWLLQFFKRTTTIPLYRGGAFFEKDCVCTQLDANITNLPNYGDGYVDNECRYKTVDGEWTNITATLFDEDPDTLGRWLTQVGGGSPANYTIIAIKSDEYSVEYDCKTSSLGITNYCIHVMSRTPTLSEDTFKHLIEMAESLGLNPQQLPYTMTIQEGC